MVAPLSQPPLHKRSRTGESPQGEIFVRCRGGTIRYRSGLGIYRVCMGKKPERWPLTKLIEPKVEWAMHVRDSLEIGGDDYVKR